MRYPKLLGLFILTLVIFSSCKKDESIDNDSSKDQDLVYALDIHGGKDSFILPDASDLNAIPEDPLNPLTEAKVKLGQMLYHETAIALNPIKDFAAGTYSCATCHFASAGFQAGRVQGISDGSVGFGVNGEGRSAHALYEGEQIDCQPIRSPSILNTAFQEVMLWNGQFGAQGVNEGTEASWTAGTPKENNHFGYQGLEIQAIAGLDVHRLVIDEQVLKNIGYEEMFEAAFPDWDDERRYSPEGAGLAIAAYERTVMATEAPFQKWLKGDTKAMTDLEKEGAILFFTKAECASCHTGPALSNMEFHGYGMGDLHECPEEIFRTPADAVEHLGRGGFTGDASENYKFKTPQLYNLSDSPFYGHGSSFRTIKDVVEYKNEAVPQKRSVPTSQLATQFRPLGLSDYEVSAITEFIEKSLRDPNLGRYEPSSLPSGNCFPNADPMSKNDLGCN